MTCHDEHSAPVATGLRRFVLVGSPNCGKTTLFNALTGLRAKTGNYPGVTVSRYEGVHKLGDVEAIIEDLPGTYSLDPISPDEEVVTEVLDAGESVTRRSPGTSCSWMPHSCAEASGCWPRCSSANAPPSRC